MREPGIRALARKPFMNERVQRRVVVELLAALVAIQDHQRHAPEPLPRNAPVGPLGDHRVNPLGAPLRCPFHFGDFRERARPNRGAVMPSTGGPRAIQIDEPLFGGAEDHRIVAPPAMRVTVRKFLLAEQRSAIAQQLNDDRIRLEYCFPFVLGQPFEIPAMIIDRRVRLDAIFLPGLEVLDAMPRRRVHDAGALIERDVIGQHRRHDSNPKTDAGISTPRGLFPSTARARLPASSFSASSAGPTKSAARSNAPAAVSTTT